MRWYVGEPFRRAKGDRAVEPTKWKYSVYQVRGKQYEDEVYVSSVLATADGLRQNGALTVEMQKCIERKLENLPSDDADGEDWD